MNYNKYDEVINGEHTYRTIVENLKKCNTVGIGWTDEISSHHDIIFKLGVVEYGYFRRGIKWYDLYVSIIGHTSYAFDTSCEKGTAYIQEKINMHNESGVKIAQLINGVIRELLKQNGER